MEFPFVGDKGDPSPGLDAAPMPPPVAADAATAAPTLEERLLERISALDRKVDSHFQALRDLIIESRSRPASSPTPVEAPRSLSVLAPGLTPPGTVRERRSVSFEHAPAHAKVPLHARESIPPIITSKTAPRVKRIVSFEDFAEAPLEIDVKSDVAEPAGKSGGVKFEIGAERRERSDSLEFERRGSNEPGAGNWDGQPANRADSDSDDSDASFGDDDSRGSFSSYAESTFNYNEEHDDDGKEEGPPVLNDSDVLMINPRNPFRMTWDLAVLLPFLLYLTIVMPFRLCFANEPILFTPIYWFEFLIDMVFIVDICFNFFTGYIIETDHHMDEVMVEYDRMRVAKNYATSWFVLDVVSGVPFALLDLIMNSGTDNTGSLKSAKTLKLLRFLKLGRLLKIDKILSGLDRETLDIIEDTLNVRF